MPPRKTTNTVKAADKKRTVKGKVDAGAVVREIARERVGIVKPARPIDDPKQRKKPKYKKDPLES